MSRCPCAKDSSRYSDKREAREKELCSEVVLNSPCEGGDPVCKVVEVDNPPDWRAQQEQDPDLQLVLQWVESGQKPLWDEVAGCLLATKGLFEKFGTLRVKDGMLQRAWKEPAIGEER